MVNYDLPNTASYSASIKSHTEVVDMLHVRKLAPPNGKHRPLFNTADEGCRAANYAVCNDVYTDIQVSYYELSSAIYYLNINKSCGLDGIYAEHLKFGPYLLADLLSQWMSSFFTHGYLPDSMIASVLVPVIK